MRVVVTGGSGYVGGVVVDRLAKQHDVAVYDTVAPAAAAEFIAGDILDLEGLTEAFTGVDAVVHLAAIPVPFRDPDDRVMMVNVMGTERVAAAAAERGVTRLIAASSDSTLGFVFGGGAIVPEYVPCDEDHPLRPADAYGLSKLMDEDICRRYTRVSGLETICLRYCWVWSEREYVNIAALQAQPETFVGQLWGYIDVRDVAQGCAKALTAEEITHETLFLSARRTFAGRPSLELIEEFLPSTVEVRMRESFDAEPQRCLHDYSRATEKLAYEPEYDWEECVRALGR